ncbi:hypothetical protein FOA52_008210 [Chlamydomonas sp. UWO 241]|nr:hypothetical protein FOA52_008210 [Chlamydomonas sp. UWO 241]
MDWRLCGRRLQVVQAARQSPHTTHALPAWHMASVASYGSEYSHMSVRRLEELSKTRAKVASLERAANTAAEAELARRKLDVLMAVGAYRAQGGQLASMGSYVAELKQYLQSVYDADLLCDPTLPGIALEHCIAYAVRLTELMADPVEYESPGSFAVMELSASTLSMMSVRPHGARALAAAGGAPVVARLLSPRFPSVISEHVAVAAGSLAADIDGRLSFRAHGGVGALVRLLRSDIEAGVQAAAASALCLLASRDTVVQNSARYLGAIDLLVGLLATGSASVAEAAHSCLAALRRGNARNTSEVHASVRASGELPPRTPPRMAAPELYPDTDFLSAASKVRSLLGDLNHARPATASAASAHADPGRPASVARPASAASAPTSARSTYGGSRTPSYSPVASVSVAAAATWPRAPRTPAARSPAADASVVGSSVGGSSAVTWGYEASLKASIRELKGLRESMDRDGDDWRLGTGTYTPPAAAIPSAEIEAELLRRKHLARFSPEEACLLLEEMGFDRLDLRPFRVARVSGASLLLMGKDELSIDMALPRAKVASVLGLQRAVRLFDSIATLPRQGRLTEVELRLWLASKGASSATGSKVLALVRSLVRTGTFDFVTFWDFVTSFEWVSQALRIFNLPC